MERRFHRLAVLVSEGVGSPYAFGAALALVAGWAVTGPLFGFSETWQLVINTGTTIVTFLMVFLLQHTQVADTKALHAKLDELIVSLPEPRNEMAGIEGQDNE